MPPRTHSATLPFFVTGDTTPMPSPKRNQCLLPCANINLARVGNCCSQDSYTYQTQPLSALGSPVLRFPYPLPRCFGMMSPVHHNALPDSLCQRMYSSDSVPGDLLRGPICAQRRDYCHGCRAKRAIEEINPNKQQSVSRALREVENTKPELDGVTRACLKVFVSAFTCSAR